MADIKVKDLQKVTPKSDDYIFMIGEDSEYQGKVAELSTLVIDSVYMKAGEKLNPYGEDLSVAGHLFRLDSGLAEAKTANSKLRDDVYAEITLSEATKNLWSEILGG